MSQAKVNKYKEEKANRAQLVRKQKVKRRLKIFLAVAIICVAAVWFGTAVYMSNRVEPPAQEVAVDYDAIEDYFSTINE